MKIESYITKIIEETGLSKKEIQERVEEKKIELKGLISDEGALFIIAKELGVDVKEENKELLKDIEINISDISLNMKNICLVGRIKEIGSIHEFNRKDGGTGYVSSFTLHDKTGDMRIVLWDDRVKIIQNENFVFNELVKIINGNAKKGRYGDIEINIGKFSKIIISPEDVDYNKYPKIKEEFININDINLNLKSISIEGKIIQIFPIREFTKKNGDEGKVGSLNIMDSTGSIRVTFWNEDTSKIEPIKIDDIISITNLNPRLSNLDSKTIDLFGNRNSTIIKKDKKINIESDIVDSIKNLQELKGIVSFKGVVSSIDDLREVALKSGENVSLLGFVVSDKSDGIRVTLWREKAEEFSEKLTLGQGLLLKNCLIKYSSFSGRNEISFINDSSIEIIDLEIKNLESPHREGEEIEKINSLQDRKGFVTFQGIVSSIDNLRTISLKNGENVSILGFVVSDETDGIRVTLWREKAEEFSEKLKVGTGVLLKNTMLKFSNYSSRNEVSMNKDSSLEIIDLQMKNLKGIEPQTRMSSSNFSGIYTQINSIDTSGIYEIKGFIAKEITKIITYEACSNCNKKIDNCTCDKTGDTVNRLIISMIIDDESATIRATFFGEKAEKIIGEETELIVKLKETPDFEKFMEKKSSELLGKDIIIKGKARFSDFSNSYDINVFNFKELDINEELEKVMKEIEI